MTKISVIVPVYNVEQHLQDCLNSIINQTLTDIEIICVDDGSTDNSLAVLQEYEQRDNRIIVLQQKNQGAGAARNKGLAIAKGEYLYFPDSDDFFELSLLEEAYRKCEEDNADIVVFQAVQYVHKTQEKKYMPWAYKKEYFPETVPFSYKDMPDYIFNSFQNWAWNKMFRAEFIKKNNIKFQEIKRTNDLLFTCSALVKAERITLLERQLVYYRVGHGGNCQATNNKAPLDFYEAFFALKKYLISQNIYEEVQKSFVNWALGSCLYNLDSIKDATAKKVVYNKLKKDGFKNLDIDKFSENYFYDKRRYYEYRQIMQSTRPTLRILNKIWFFYREHGMRKTLEKIKSVLGERL